MSRSLLPVSIVGGPAAPELAREIAKAKATTRLGLLASSKPGKDLPNKSEFSNLFVEELASLREGDGHDPVRIAEQISAIAEKEIADHLLLECDAHTPVMAFASLFLSHAHSLNPLTGVARLTTTILAIPPSYFIDRFIRRSNTADPFSPCFLAEQLEFADIIVLASARNDPDFSLARGIIRSLNPRAQVFELSQKALQDSLGSPGASFDFAAALEGAGWRRLIDGQPHQRSDNISAFAYHSRKPFHPERFWNLLQPGFPGVFRAKGFFWLATRMDLVGGLNFAAGESHYAAAGNWWAARDEQDRELQMPDRTRKEWKEPFGDRRQALAFMGVDLNSDTLRAQLDACLLTDAEAGAGPEIWRGLSDPFPCWHHAHVHDDDCEHDHESDKHDCCHH